MKYWIGFFIYFILTLVAAAFICSRVSPSRQHEEVEPASPDTVYLFKYDTITITKLKYKEKKVIDTLYIETKDSSKIKLPITQKLFSEANLYDIWISGVEPINLDSANVYNKTEYRTVVQYHDRVAYKDEFKIYAGGGFYSFSGNLNPYLGVSIQTKSKWLIEANFGYKGYFEVGAKYKLF